MLFCSRQPQQQKLIVVLHSLPEANTETGRLVGSQPRVHWVPYALGVWMGQDLGRAIIRAYGL
jgi:hypothetical protein